MKKKKNKKTKVNINKTIENDFFGLSSSYYPGKPIVAIRMRQSVTEIRVPDNWTKKLKFWKDEGTRYETIKSSPFFEIKREGSDNWERVYEETDYKFIDLEELKKDV